MREALGTLVSPQMCDQLIARSLVAHGLEAVPEGGRDVGSWLEESLRPAVELAVGPDAADLLMSQLGPIVAYAAISQPKAAPLAAVPAPPAPRPVSSFPVPAVDDEFDEFDEPDRPTALRFDTSAEPNWEREPSRGIHERSTVIAEPHPSGPPTGIFQGGNELTFSPLPPANANVGPSSVPVRTLPPARPITDRPRSPVPMHTTRPQPIDKLVSEVPSGLPQVLTATNDQGDLAALKRYLSGTAQVTHIPDLVGLLDALEDPELLEPIVLIDCQRPSVHITSVAAIGEDLPKGTTVVLWGADDATWQQIDRERSPSCRWVRCSREATTDDVGSLCSMLLG